MYLRAKITNKAGCGPEIIPRNGMAREALRRLKEVWKNNKTKGD